MRAAMRERLVEVMQNGSDPLTFLLSVVSDQSVDLPTRIAAAEILLPFTCPRQNGSPPRVEKGAQNLPIALDIPS